MKTSTLSKNIIQVMNALRYNDRLVNLALIDNNDIEFVIGNRPSDFESNVDNMPRKNLQIVNQNSKFCRILPTPFNPNAEDEDKTMIRVYYNQGDFDGEIISQTSLFIDIIVAKSRWLIYDQAQQEQMVRPYEIMTEIIETIGRKSGNPLITVNFTGWQHLAVNTKFDAIRLYSEYFKPEM